MRPRLRETARMIVRVITLLAFASAAWADDQVAVVVPEELKAAYDLQMADADVVPKTVQDAFVAAEDRYFYSGKFASSTITQVLAKRFLRPGLGMVSHKTSEILTTLAIEQILEGDEILAWYLQTIYLGRGCYGVEAAAQAYFNRSPEALTLAQAAMLAALPKAPTKFDPSRHPDKALRRRDFVLAEMVKAGFVTQDAAAVAASSALGAIEPPVMCDG